MEKFAVANVLIVLACFVLLCYILLFDIMQFSRGIWNFTFELCCYTTFTIAGFLLCREQGKMDRIIGLLVAAYGLLHCYLVIGFILYRLAGIDIDFPFIMQSFWSLSPGLVLAAGIAILGIWRARGNNIPRLLAGISLVALSMVNVIIEALCSVLYCGGYRFMLI
jgi:hypothetical protein